MPPPIVSVMLTTPSIPGGVELAGILSQETNANISFLIEDPTGTNSFTAGDVSLKGYDAPNGTTVSGYFAAMTPTSTNFTVAINLGLVLSDGSHAFDVLFAGYVAPNTLQFEPQTGAFSFTVIGIARNLQTTDASTLFLRPGYFDGKWWLNADASSLDKFTPTIQVATVNGIPTATPDFLTGDVIQLDTGDKVTITNVIPDPSTSPPAFYSLQILPVPTKNYAANAPVHLLTPYLRNLDLETQVLPTLFTAAGFPNKQYFASAPLPNSSALFTQPMNLTGLTGGLAGGIAAVPESGGLWIAASNANGAFTATGPKSGFTLYSAAAGFQQPPIDATNYGTGSTMFGPKRARTRLANPRYGLNVTMVFYAYDHLAQNKRYVLTVHANSDHDTPVFDIQTTLASETCVNGVWVWGTTTAIPGVGINTTTSTDMTDAYDAIGIDVDPATGTVFFTDIQLTGAAGSAATMNTSSYQPGGAGYVAARVTGLNGPIVVTAPGRCVVVQNDGILGKDPTAKTYTLSAAGVMTLQGTAKVSPYLVSRSLKKNAGDGNYYALIGDPTLGVQIAKYASDILNQVGTPSNLQPTPAPPTPSNSPQLQVLQELDLVVQYGVSNGVGVACPMYAFVGGVPVFVGNSSTGLVPYVDMTGLSVADALQQLSTTIAGIFYLNENGNDWIFRSRSSPMPGNTIGTNDQIDGDPGLLSLTIQPVFNRWVGYVSVANDTNALIFGDTSQSVPGSITYANASGLNIQLKSRFVTSSSFAAALATSLYNYLGAKKRWIEVNRVRDGRVYEVGRTFHCNADGANRNFQIIEVDLAITGVAVKVIGLEV